MTQSSENDAFGRVNVSIKINDVDSKLSPSAYAVTLYDSIHSLYPKLKMIWSDYYGVVTEYLGAINGTKIEVSLGKDEASAKSCPFIIAKNAMPQQTASDSMGGNVELELIHEWFYKQEKSCNAWQSNISDIITELTNKYEFESTNIESTTNSGYWYQPFINDSEFIMEYLLPFAFSSSASNTPFYCFVDSNNNFNFKSFNSMFNQTPIKELEYTNDGMRTIADEKCFSNVKFMQLEMSKMRPFFNTEYYSYDKDGTYVSETDKLLDYMKTNGKYPINGNASTVTNVISLYDEDLKADDTKNNNKGLKINVHNECVLPDKVIINLPLDRELVSGKVVKISMPMCDSNASTDKSLRNSGNYLIESSYHMWDTKNARTMIVCSKQNVNLNGNYSNNNRLFMA